MLNKFDFLLLSNICHPILFSVNESRLYQHKPTTNVKPVSGHVSLVYVSSVSEPIKPLNFSKPLFSSKATTLKKLRTIFG